MIVLVANLPTVSDAIGEWSCGERPRCEMGSVRAGVEQQSAIADAADNPFSRGLCIAAVRIAKRAGLQCRGERDVHGPATRRAVGRCVRRNNSATEL